MSGTLRQEEIDNASKKELIRLLSEDKNFAEEISKLIISSHTCSIPSYIPDLSVDNLHVKQNQDIQGELLITTNFNMRLPNGDNRYAPIRMYGGQNPRISAGALNVDELFIQGKKVSILEERKITMCTDTYSTWG